MFQFTPLREGRPLVGLTVVSVTSFQFTPLREGRLARFFINLGQLAVSIHAPARGATHLHSAISPSTFQFQFTPLREGRQGRRRPKGRYLLVSIHAPARGATFHIVKSSSPILFQFTPLREGRPDDYPELAEAVGFQFTPLREGRHIVCLFHLLLLSFNSRPCERGDQAFWHCIYLSIVSIHAPARGATAAASCKETTLRCFNSRPCERGDI